MKLKLFSVFAFLCFFLSFGQTFFMVGAASVAGWDSSNPVSMYSNNNSSTVYTYLIGNDSFRFLGQKNWQPLNYSIDAPNIRPEYRYFKTFSSNVVTNSTDDENMRFAGAAGYYKVQINTVGQILNISLQQEVYNTNFPELYIIGSLQAWNPSTAIVIPSNPAGIGKYKTTINIPNGTEFKIFGQKSFDGAEYGNLGLDNPGYSGFLGYKGDNGNFKIDGANNPHSIEIDLRRGLIQITDLVNIGTEDIITNSKPQRRFSPNPAKDKIIFSTDLKTVSIFDLSGKLLQTSNVNGKELNISTLKPGNYILKITTENGNFTEKLVKK